MTYLPRQPLQRLRDRLVADAAAFGMRWRGDGDRRGMVLVTTLMMMTVLALLGSAATTATSTQLRENGATRLEHLTFRVGESAAMASVALAAQLQGGFEDYVVNRNYKFDMTDMGPLFELKSGGSFGRELDAIAWPTIDVQISPPTIAYGVEGYDAARYCFRSYTMKTYAKVGDPDSQKAAEKANSGRIGFQAGVTVGPVPCGN